MCGIFGVTGQIKKPAEAVLKGLRALEYRGYDSWGIVTRNKIGKSIVCKDIGKISEAECVLPEGIESFGHSRWATHGGVTPQNAHPHTVGRVTIVHNGIFENFAELKVKFPTDYKSETDTEAGASVLSHYFEKGLHPEECIRKLAEKAHGRYAILAFFEGHAGIYAARRGSPLIIGRGEGVSFIASDIPAFLEYTKLVNYLDDNEMVHLVGGDAEFFNLTTGKSVPKRTIAVQWEIEQAEIGDNPHFMIKEIREQKQTLRAAMEQSNEKLKKAAKILKKSKGVYVISCGTANKASMAGEYFFSTISGRKVNVVPASEMSYFMRFIRKDTLLVAVSQSGETADVLEILEQGKKNGANILAITNVESSSMARMADVHLPLLAGPEVAVASTKAATSQMAVLFLLANADAGHINEGREILLSTSGAVNDMINPRYEDHIHAIAEKIVKHDNLFIIGRGPLYPMALEAAIKIQEVSYIHAQGFAAGELKHGPIALIEEGVPVLVLGNDPETINNAQEVKARGAKIIGISATKADVFDDWIRVPDCDGLQCVASIVPVQILSYHLAVLRGVDPDKPRNLAKSVTVK